MEIFNDLWAQIVAAGVLGVGAFLWRYRKAVRGAVGALRVGAEFVQAAIVAVDQVEAVEVVIQKVEDLEQAQKEHAQIVADELEHAKRSRGEMRQAQLAQGRMLDDVDSRLARLEGKIDVLLTLVDRRQEQLPLSGPDRRSHE